MRDGPFHPGEILIQQRLGVAEKMRQVGGRVIRDYMPEQHIEFFRSLPMLFLGAHDKQHVLWASVLCGDEGFIDVPDPKTLIIHTQFHQADALYEQLEAGHKIGLLGMALSNRRRNRLNGTITEKTSNSLSIRVDQSFGNCPKYIQTRSFLANPNFDKNALVQTISKIENSIVETIKNSHTFYVASQFDDGNQDANRGVDISHRGGNAGFVRVENDDTITFPDFIGNYMFNTLGNLQCDPLCSLLFIEDDSGSMLQLSGQAEIIWDDPSIAAFQGAERLVRFKLISGRFIAHGLPYRWSDHDFSPFLDSTGRWSR